VSAYIIIERTLHGSCSLSPSFNEAPIRTPSVHVQGRTGGHSILSGQVITWIKAITVTKDEANLADYLSGEAAQTLIDVVYEVSLRRTSVPSRS
jgi:hypothetical protein